MQQNSRYPYADDALMMSAETTADDVREFVKDRLDNPVEVKGITVYNFSSHRINMALLREAAAVKLESDLYVIPYQVTGVWGWMTKLLPDELQTAEVLTFVAKEHEYVAFGNMLSELQGEFDE